MKPCVMNAFWNTKDNIYISRRVLIDKYYELW